MTMKTIYDDVIDHFPLLFHKVDGGISFNDPDIGVGVYVCDMISMYNGIVNNVYNIITDFDDQLTTKMTIEFDSNDVICNVILQLSLQFDSESKRLPEYKLIELYEMGIINIVYWKKDDNYLHHYEQYDRDSIMRKHIINNIII